MAAQRRAAGFTLIELLAVLAILGLAYGLAAPYLARALPAMGLSQAERAVISALREARGAAAASGAPVRFALTEDRRGWRIGDGTATEAPGGVALALAGAPAARRDGAEAIVFFPDGGATGGKVSLSAGARRAAVTVDWVTGRVRAAR